MLDRYASVCLLFQGISVLEVDSQSPPIGVDNPGDQAARDSGEALSGEALSAGDNAHHG